MNGFGFKVRNFKMYISYDLLIKKSIRVYDIKTDAITSQKDDIDEVYGFYIMKRCKDGKLIFGKETGGWQKYENKN